MSSADNAYMVSREEPPNTCGGHFLRCRAGTAWQVILPAEVLGYLDTIQPRLGVTRLARALGVSVGTLDTWTCGRGSGHGLRPAKAATMAERFWRLVLHLQQAQGCSCRICTPTAQERARERFQGHGGAGRIQEPPRVECFGTAGNRGAA